MQLSRGHLAGIAASLLAGLVYLNALNNPFIYDDYRTIIDNGSLVDLRDLRAIAGHDITRPLVNLSYAIDRRIWGPQPFGFHVSSILLHMLNVFLLFELARRLAGDRNRQRREPASGSIQAETAAFATAAIFAVHPLMTQAVGYISGRSEVLCAVGVLGAILAGRRWMLSGGAAAWLAVWLLWIASLMARETGIVLPVVLLAVDRLAVPGTPEDRRRRLMKLHVPLIGAATLAAIARVAIFVVLEQPNGLHIRWLAIYEPAIVIWQYAALLIVPAGQAIVHEIVPVTSAADPRGVAALLGLGFALLAAWTARHRFPLLSLGVVWFLVLLTPSSVLMVMHPTGDMAEHRVYLASVGLVLIAGSCVGWLASRSRAEKRLRWIAALILPAVLLPLAGRTLLRNATWGSPVLMWSEAVERNPDNWLCRTVLGESLHEAGRHEEAVTQHRLALAQNPEEESISLKLGFCLTELRRFDEAAATFEELRARHPASTTALTGLGLVAMMSGRPQDARVLFQEAIARPGRDVRARHWLARLEEQAGNAAEALRLCEEIQRIEPGGLENDQCVRRNRARLGR